MNLGVHRAQLDEQAVLETSCWSPGGRACSIISPGLESLLIIDKTHQESQTKPRQFVKKNQPWIDPHHRAVEIHIWDDQHQIKLLFLCQAEVTFPMLNTILMSPGKRLKFNNESAAGLGGPWQTKQGVYLWRSRLLPQKQVN